MPSTRKTVSVERLVEMVNATLLESPEGWEAQRQGAAGVLESVLFETGNYRGFSYLPSEWDEGMNRLREDFDSTRRRYF